MIVVSDTTPLNYLILIDAVEVLSKLFVEVHVPTAVIDELTHPKAPAAVREWTHSAPAWFKVADPKLRLPSTDTLDLGEAAAISLAKERGIKDLLIDEYRGRKVAVSEGLFVLPTLAVLERSAEQGILELGPAVEALRRTSYRVRSELMDAALQRDAARRRAASK